ncbi:hypothetical protein R3P38DRAFT_3332875 [Favolaschia claudopus]|uniref:SWIM-type domain-containing protein n=1 Tax=Favolaschia claudopus TaxID=2862362 RepID=A0AAV9ZJG6_9AGAR
MPLGFLLERLLTQLLTHFKDVWKLDPRFTLTDKDRIEINACLKVFPGAKHQLSCTEFEFIDKNFRSDWTIEGDKPGMWFNTYWLINLTYRQDTFVATERLPQLSIRLRGVPMSGTPRAPEQMPQPSLTIRLAGTVRSVVPRSEYQPPLDSAPASAQEEDLDLDEQMLDEFLESLGAGSADDRDEEDGPDWLFEEGEKRASDPHNFCQHPIFPTVDGARSATQIRRDAVFEMFWGYFWTSWYCPAVWKLWARSASERLSRWRTTMTVENFWKQLKHDFLHSIARPRLDLLIWVLITRVTPAYLLRVHILADNYRGHSQNAEEVYITSVERWTCTCKAQAFNALHLCKHLVQAVPTPPTKFWTEFIDVVPFPLYRHQALTTSQTASTDLEDPGSITDGDDHRTSFALSQSCERTTTLLGKRLRDSDVSMSTQSTPTAPPVPVLPPVAAFNLVSEEVLDEQSAHLEKLASDLEEAARMIRSQIPHRNALWMASLTRRNVGSDVSALVGDIRRFERTSRSQETTWPENNSGEEVRRVANTMGYQIRN